MQAQEKKIAELLEIVKTADKRRTDYEDVTIKLKHLWDQVCDDLSLLAQRAVGELVRDLCLSPKPGCVLLLLLAKEMPRICATHR